MQTIEHFNMKKKVYLSPWSQDRELRLQFNAMSPAVVDTVSDNGLPQLDSDDNTLGWLDE